MRKPAAVKACSNQKHLTKPNQILKTTRHPKNHPVPFLNDPQTQAHTLNRTAASPKLQSKHQLGFAFQILPKDFPLLQFLVRLLPKSTPKMHPLVTKPTTAPKRNGPVFPRCRLGGVEGRKASSPLPRARDVNKGHAAVLENELGDLHTGRPSCFLEAFEYIKTTRKHLEGAGRYIKHH